MKRWFVVLALVAGSWLASGGEAQGQTRADTAAVLLQAAERLRTHGDAAAARAVLDLIARDYADTPAAAEVERMLAAVQRMPERERSGRTELMVWSATYGAWLGVALPLMLESDSPEAYGLGLLAGAPAGFFIARGATLRRGITEGQARAVTFGGTYGTFQGFGWTHVLDIGADKSRNCDPFGQCFESDSDPSEETLVAAAVLGGVGGIITGVVLAQKPITSGTATAVTHGGLWGTWFGWGLSFIAGSRDDSMLTGALIGGDIALVASAIMAPEWRLSESRARLISIGGVIGGLAGLGLMLIVQPDDEGTAAAFPVFGSAIGLGLGAHHTRNHDARAEEGGASRGALLNLQRGRWTMDLPEPSLQLQRDNGSEHTAVYVPLLKARF